MGAPQDFRSYVLKGSFHAKSMQYKAFLQLAQRLLYLN